MFGIDDAIAAGSKLVDDVVTRIWPDATEVEKAKLAQIGQQVQNQYNLILSQIDVNKTEASSTSVFVAGWRPFVGWVCASALAYAAIIEPVLRFVCTVAFAYAGVYPVIDTNLTLQILFGILGLGAYRSYDKKQGTSK